MLHRICIDFTEWGEEMVRSLRYLGAAVMMSLGPWLLTGAGAQYTPPDPESKAATKKGLKNQHLDPDGEPAAFARQAGPLYAVWRDRDGWHLRLRSDRRSHHFKGRVRIEGGLFDKLSSYRGEKFAPAAHWKLQKNKQELTFDFRSGERLDGIRFRVSPNAQQVVFALFIDQSDQPGVVNVGKRSQFPEVLPMALPAHSRTVKVVP
jgi:hypothetical protein